MAHIKRAKVAEEAKREAENPIKGKHFDQSILSVDENLRSKCRIFVSNI